MTSTMLPFECGVCCEKFVDTPSVFITADDVICLGCFTDNIKAQFLAALEHEHAYPVTWGNVKLNPAHFADLLPTGFVHRWIWKVEREYKIPANERVYCGGKIAAFQSISTDSIAAGGRTAHAGGNATTVCGKYLGTTAPPTGARCMVKCSSCTTMTCRICCASVASIGHVESHVCFEEVEPDPFEGMKLGKDYQRCPKCDTPVTLRDGCNGLVCAQCGCPFCYICGEEVGRREREHWAVGRPCPRFNQPGAKNALYDTDTGAGDPTVRRNARDRPAGSGGARAQGLERMTARARFDDAEWEDMDDPVDAGVAVSPAGDQQIREASRRRARMLDLAGRTQANDGMPARFPARDRDETDIRVPFDPAWQRRFGRTEAAVVGSPQGQALESEGAVPTPPILRPPFPISAGFQQRLERRRLRTLAEQRTAALRAALQEATRAVDEAIA